MAEQTTESRVQTLLADHLRRDGYSLTAGVADALKKACVVIAANIDSRANRVDVLMRHRRELLAKLHTGRAEIDGLTTQLAEARAELVAKDARIAELEQLATLAPIKVGDISTTLGLTETGEVRMTFDGADDATLAVVAGKFALAMQATMDGAK